MRIDLNCDVGESFGNYQIGVDEQIIPLVSSVNIACGYHAGDPLIMQKTILLAQKYGAGIGAHPGYPDLQGFGRRSISFKPDEIEAMVLYQIGALYGFCRANGAELVHVKPHGALYNQAAKDMVTAASIARAVKRFSPSLTLVGLSGSCMIDAAEEAGICALQEGFPDRGYASDGGLLPRGTPGSILSDPDDIARQAISLATREKPKIDTLCLHGDHPNVVVNALRIRKALSELNIEIGLR